MTENITVTNKSGDKKYFTMTPNMIIDEAKPRELALYIHLKRIAGDHGTCYVSRRNQTVKFKMDHRTISRELKTLIAKGWVVDLGMKNMPEHGQKVREVAIADLWQSNMAQYSAEKQGDTDMYPLGSTKMYHREGQGGTVSPHLGGTVSPRKKNIHTIKKKNTTGAEAPEGFVESDHQIIVDTIELFKPLNPSIDRYYGRTSEREAVRRMVKKYGQEKVHNMIKALPEILSKRGAPQITTPIQLEQKLGQLLIFINQNKQQSKF
jgi:hypothetical protein